MMKMNNDKDKEQFERIKEKLDFYLDKQIKIHITLINGKFFNGLLISKEDDYVYKMNERFLGEKYIFINEIYEVSEFKEAE